MQTVWHRVKQYCVSNINSVSNIMNEETKATFRVEPVDGKIGAKTQDFVAQKAGVLQRLFCRNPHEELLPRTHWNDFISLARRNRFNSVQFNGSLFAKSK